jgi:outer membrane biosynthesis protein TonB
MSSFGKAGYATLAVIVLLVLAGSAKAASDAPGPATAAVCPIVYPVDQSPSDRGYQYIFYGNGFFINKEGYLITAAHVLSQLRDAQPYILLQLPMAPPRLVKATVITMDQDHDVAVLRATPNPFTGRYRVNFLRLATERPAQGHAVLADALHPSRLKNPYTFDALLEDRPAGEVLEYRFTQLDKGRPDTEIFLFNHDVLLGDSGAPVVSAGSAEVVGLVEGRWLHGGGVAPANDMQKQSASLGAVVPIHYAIAVLVESGIAWEGVSDSSPPDNREAPSKLSLTPVPLSLVAAPYPTEVFSSADVVLDAAVTSSGRLVDLRIVHGENPFLEKVLAAVHTWTFQPARLGEKVAATRIGIIFQFSGCLTSTRAGQGYTYVEQPADVPERGAQPLVTPEPDLTSTKLAEGSVILCEQVDARGRASSIEIVRGPQALSAPTVAASQEWRFAPARRGGADTDSEVVVVVTFRLSAASAKTPIRKSSR